MKSGGATRPHALPLHERAVKANEFYPVGRSESKEGNEVIRLRPKRDFIELDLARVSA